MIDATDRIVSINKGKYRTLVKLRGDKDFEWIVETTHPSATKEMAVIGGINNGSFRLVKKSALRVKNPKPKKGVMPPALKAYWAARRSSVAYKRAKKSSVNKRIAEHRQKFLAKRARMAARSIKKSPRKKNPISGIAIRIEKGTQKLYFDGQHFSRFKKAKRFNTLQEAERAAADMVKKFPTVLKGWKFYASR